VQNSHANPPGGGVICNDSAKWRKCHILGTDCGQRWGRDAPNLL